MEKFIGSWKSVRAENTEAYMVAVGFEEELQAVLKVITLYLDISRENDMMHFDFRTAFLRKKYSFKLGEVFQLTTIDGRDCKMVVTLDGEKIVDVYKWNNNESVTTYEIKEGQLFWTLTYKDAVTVFTFERV